MRFLRRRRVLADLPIQGQLCIRVTLYWLGCLLSVAIPLGWWTALDGAHNSVFQWAPQFWNQYGPVFVLSLLALPLALLDCLIISNRYAGPLVRLRRAMKRMANDESVALLELRRGDLLQDVIGDFNRTATRLRESDTESQTTSHTKAISQGEKPNHEEVALS